MKKKKLHYSTKWLAGSMLMLSIAALAPVQHTHAQTRVASNDSEEDGIVTGRVTDAAGEPLPGVAVQVKGRSAGTTTDVDGRYELQLPKGVTNGTLQFSSVGYGTKEVAFDGFADIDVSMAAQSGDLNEVVVIGYGTAKKRDLTASIATVDSKEFNKGVFGTPDQMIVGKVPGLVITPSSGQPGVSGTIRIRGSASLTGNNDPLIVIDGVPVDNSTMGGAPSALSMINPNDIESFTVLKDAAATAIYGNRASNGVIIITTKKGIADDKVHVSLSSTLSYLERYRSVDVLSAAQARNYINANGTPEQIARIGTANTNWQDEIFHNTLATDNNVSISGGVKNLPYRLSVGYLGNSGLLRTTSLKRTSVSLNLSPTFFDNHLKVDVSVKGVETRNRFAATSVISNALRMDPTQPVSDGSQFGGYYEYTLYDSLTGYTPNPQAPRNPVGELNMKKDISTVRRALANVQLDYKFHFLPDLHAVVNAGADLTKSNGSVTIDPNSAVAYTNGGSYKEYSEYRRNQLFDAYLNYTKEIPDADSRFDVTAGYGYQDYYRQQPRVQTISITGTGNTVTDNAFETQNTLVSFYGRFTYAYKRRYLFSSSIRRDGSSRFSPDNRWGTFGGASVAWRISEENFLKHTKVSDLKLRAGVGSTGQQDLNTGDYPYLPVYKPSNAQTGYMFGNNPVGTYQPQPYDQHIKWESTTAYNVGLDYGFFNNRLSGSIDFYNKNTDDLLNDVRVPMGSNLSNHVVTNIGSMNNKGFEIAVNAIPVRTQDLTWSFGVNMAYNHNKITKLTSAGADDNTVITTGGINGGTGSRIQAYAVGQALNAFYVYQQIYDGNGKPLEGVYGMQEGNQLLYFYKSPIPKVTMGFNTQLAYKNWTLSLAGHASFGNYMYNNIKSSYGFKNAILDPLAYNANASTDIYNTNFEFGQYFSDYYMENASFFRMDNIVLGYNFGKLGNTSLGLQVNALVQNAFVITNYSGLDPEVFSGIDKEVYPKPRIWSLGVNVNF